MRRKFPFRHALERVRCAVRRGSHMADVVPDERGPSRHEADAAEISGDQREIDRTLIRCAGWRHQKRSMALPLAGALAQMIAPMRVYDDTMDKESDGQYGKRETHACLHRWTRIAGSGAAGYRQDRSGMVETDPTGGFDVSRFTGFFRDGFGARPMRIMQMRREGDGMIKPFITTCSIYPDQKRGRIETPMAGVGSGPITSPWLRRPNAPL
jgi:hypothetical protein